MDFIINNFSILFDTEESLKKLEEIILDLAVKGKLVSQNSDDETAHILFEKIKKEKEKLIKEKKIKKESSFEPIKEEEIPFEIPQSWKWVRLGEICKTTGGNGFPLQYQGLLNGRFPFYKVSDLSQAKNTNYIEHSNNWIDDENLIKKFTLITKESIVFPKIGGALLTNNRKILKREGFIDNNCMALTPYLNYLHEYLFLFMLTIDLGLFCQGTSIPSISQSTIENIYFPLPPLFEQKRIVEKVDSLKKLIDDLKEKAKVRDKTREELKKSIMTEIEKSDSNIDLLKNLDMVFKNFDTVVKNKEDIKDIRNLILSMAVKGKLVPQNPDDEPASVLLKKIKAEKEKLIKEKKIKKEKELEPIKEDEIPFEIPDSWEWVRLGEIAKLITDGTHLTPNYTEYGMPFLSAQNIKPFRFMPENHKFVSEEDYLKYITNKKAEKWDILLTRVGAGIGEAAVIDKDLDFAIYVSLGLIKIFHNYTYSKYINLWLNSSFGKKSSQKGTYGKGTSQGNLNLNIIINFIFPLPPLAEQKRIVEKVDRLMALCDDLENKVEKSQKEFEKIIESAMQMI